MSRWQGVALAIVGIGVAAGLSAAAEMDAGFRALLAAASPVQEHGWWALFDTAESTPLNDGLERLSTIFGLAVAGSIVVSRVRDGRRAAELEPEPAPTPVYGASRRSSA
jgi:hypothetical protein